MERKQSGVIAAWAVELFGDRVEDSTKLIYVTKAIFRLKQSPISQYIQIYKTSETFYVCAKLLNINRLLMEKTSNRIL